MPEKYESTDFRLMIVDWKVMRSTRLHGVGSMSRLCKQQNVSYEFWVDVQLLWVEQSIAIPKLIVSLASSLSMVQAFQGACLDLSDI